MGVSQRGSLEGFAGLVFFAEHLHVKQVMAQIESQIIVFSRSSAFHLSSPEFSFLRDFNINQLRVAAANAAMAQGSNRITATLDAPRAPAVMPALPSTKTVNTASNAAIESPCLLIVPFKPS